jgi:transcriptional regulator with XRE-family HTH domain
LGVSKNTLIWWESDSVIPNRYHRENIAKVLHLSEKDMKDWIWRIQK